MDIIEKLDNTAYWVTLDECANEGVYCSACKKKVYKLDYSNTMKIRSKFCPNCGRRMVDESIFYLESVVKSHLILSSDCNTYLYNFHGYKLADVNVIKNNTTNNSLLIKYEKEYEKKNDFTICIVFNNDMAVIRSVVEFMREDGCRELEVSLMRYICNLTDDVIKNCIEKCRIKNGAMVRKDFKM